MNLITEEYLQQLEAASKDFVALAFHDADRLIAEIRSLNLDAEKLVGLDMARVKQVERLQDDLFSANVELENLRKQNADLHQWLDAANEREQIQLRQAIEAIKARKTAYDLVEEVLQRIEGGRLAHIGAAGQCRVPQISLDAIAAWRAQIPKPEPHPIETLVEKTLEEGGSPT